MMKNIKEIGTIKITKQEKMPVGASIARPCYKEHAITDVGAILISCGSQKNSLNKKHKQARNNLNSTNNNNNSIINTSKHNNKPNFRRKRYL